METYAGGRFSRQNGLMPKGLKDLFRQQIDEGVLNVTHTQFHESQQLNVRRRKIQVQLQRELEYFEGPFEYKYGFEYEFYALEVCRILKIFLQVLILRENGTDCRRERNLNRLVTR